MHKYAPSALLHPCSLDPAGIVRMSEYRNDLYSHSSK